ncbi:MAG TPA: helix-turn-helix domain-containing protein [Phycisphaerales bacterium]|nr:helix-turn-helix domain-containing protein [Phycisphaerales bacterium]
MDKLFYTLEEAAERLGKSADDVRQMASSGQLEQFRDRDKLMFKKQQVDLLAGGEEEPLRLADSGELEPIGLASSGSSIGMADSSAGKDGTGISLLDDATDDSDANAVTRITTSPGALVDPGEDKRSASGSGGLLDLTREADDTSLGAGLLEDVYGGETVAAQTAATDSPSDGGALFESPAGASDFESSAPVAAVAAAEVYDGPGSGLVGGLALGAIVALGVAAFTLIMGMTGSGGGMIKTIGDNFMILIGVAAGVSLIAAVVGWLLGKKS